MDCPFCIDMKKLRKFCIKALVMPLQNGIQ
jgi:hypothetical protein